ncbi:MAG TPA: dihydroxyacetone kinase subunit DhaL [Actinomycetaceae bacterium]|nr:dihydroxyacetone kinase subunit DhaL [Actinomycetaceae bacterium]
MTETLGADWARAWMRRAASEVAARRIDLIELDRAIGDGDHGENLDRGFSAVVTVIDDTSATPAEVLRSAAGALISKVGGASGPLYGTAMLRAAKAVAGANELDSTEVAEMLAAGLTGITDRGKATVGEKTMVDAWAPAVEAAREAAGRGVSPAAVLRAAADAAAEGALATEPLIATKGRASYLGERSAGHRDPGAESSSIILTAAAEAAEGAAA